MTSILSFFLSFFITKRKYRKYKSAFYQISNCLFQSDSYDKGKYLEYLTYKSLLSFENDGGKFLFNTRIPKAKYGTTEIDVILIHRKGLFVFECKNYSGWIFGNETQKQWTQTLPIGRGRCHKEQFYNPIMQNASHIKHLKNHIGKNLPIWSVIVFSDKCEFKDLTISNYDAFVIKRSRVELLVTTLCDRNPILLNCAEINAIYSNLYPYTHL